MEFSKENLVNFLGDLKLAIERNQIPESTQHHLWDLLTCDERDSEYREMIKYLFTGWWIHTQLKQ